MILWLFYTLNIAVVVLTVHYVAQLFRHSDGAWHSWYVLLPIRIDGAWFWLTRLERRYGFLDFDVVGFQYRLPEPSSGNSAFDDYMGDTVRRLNREEREFFEFRDEQQHQRDRDEFKAFMARERAAQAHSVNQVAT